MQSQQPPQNSAPGLRVVALASVAALAVVLPLAAATEGPRERAGHSGRSGPAELGVPHAKTASGDGYWPHPRPHRAS